MCGGTTEDDGWRNDKTPFAPICVNINASSLNEFLTQLVNHLHITCLLLHHKRDSSHLSHHF